MNETQVQVESQDDDVRLVRSLTSDELAGGLA